MSEYNCECGKTYKHHASLYKHQRSHKHGKFATHGEEEVEESLQDPSEDTHTSESLDDPSSPPDDEPSYSWQSFEVETDEEVSTPIPSILKGMKRHSAKKVRNMTGAERESQRRLIGIAYRGADGILERYGQAVIEDVEFEISRTQSDYDWISGLTLEMCEEQGWSGIPISSTGLWMIGTGYWVGKPITEIQKKRTKPLGSGKGSFLTKIPILGRFLKRKKSKKVREYIDSIDIQGVEDDGEN